MGTNDDSAVCGWAPVPGDDENWKTDCGEYWMLLEGTPAENDMKFCPMCGKKLVTQ